MSLSLIFLSHTLQEIQGADGLPSESHDIVAGEFTIGVGYGAGRWHSPSDIEGNIRFVSFSKKNNHFSKKKLNCLTV
jgi:hypothetical protein